VRKTFTAVLLAASALGVAASPAAADDKPAWIARSDQYTR
jgi:hypothetical protein